MLQPLFIQTEFVNIKELLLSYARLRKDHNCWVVTILPETFRFRIPTWPAAIDGPAQSLVIQSLGAVETVSKIMAETPGAGIGLSLVKHTAEAHGGRVELDSSPGEGSTFTLVLDPGDEGGAKKEESNPRGA